MCLHSLFSLAAFLLANKLVSLTGSFISFCPWVEIARIWGFWHSVHGNHSCNETLKKKIWPSAVNES